MQRILERLHRDHVNLRWILDLLARQLDSFFAGKESDFDLKVELLEYIECYAEFSHHPTEDLIFKEAMPRAGEKQPLLERLMDQHQRLTRATRRFRRSLENVMQGGVMLRDELEVQGREFIALQRMHLDIEEDEAFPLVERLLDPDQWERIATEMPALDDPLFGQRDPSRFRTLVSYLAEKED